MNQRKHRGRHARAGEIADLFKVLKAMAADPKVKDGDFRLAFRIAQAVDQRTGWAEIGDARLAEETASGMQAPRRARRSLEESGWLHTEQGGRGRPTRYLFLEHNVAAITARLKAADEAREEAWNLEQIERRTAAASKAMAIRIDRETGEITDPNPIKSDHVSPSDMKALLPKSSTSSLSVKDVAEDTHVPVPEHACCECGKPAPFFNPPDAEWYCERHIKIHARDA